MNKAIIWIVILLGLIVGGYYFLFYGKNQSAIPNSNEDISGLDEKTIPSAIENFYQKYDPA